MATGDFIYPPTVPPMVVYNDPQDVVYNTPATIRDVEYWKGFKQRPIDACMSGHLVDEDSIIDVGTTVRRQAACANCGAKILLPPAATPPIRALERLLDELCDHSPADLDALQLCMESFYTLKGRVEEAEAMMDRARKLVSLAERKVHAWLYGTHRR